MKIGEEIMMFLGGMRNLLYMMITFASALLIIMPIYWLYGQYELDGTLDSSKLHILLIEIPAIPLFIISWKFFRPKKEVSMKIPGQKGN